MNREIKFRAFFNGQMITDEEVHFVFGKLGIGAYKYGECREESFNQDNAVFMQSTGMKDKKNTVGYEGDVVERNSSVGKGSVRGIIKFIDGEFIIDWIKIGVWNNVLKYHLPESEIIGNIHQNPELIKK